jgi:putative tRNA adenosine deaminase-associated protein
MVRNLPITRHDVRVSYFTAVIAADGPAWRARDVDVEDAGSLDDLADILRGAAQEDGTVLAVIEREDEWFALVRVDDDDEPRVFVSDMGAASRSPYAELLAPAADVDVVVDPPEALDASGEEELPPVQEEPVDVSDDDEAVELAEEPLEDDPVVWAGEPDLLVDLGVSAQRLCELAQEHGDDPASVLAEVGEECGFGELLDALR